jgi:hypothetical protein
MRRVERSLIAISDPRCSPLTPCILTRKERSSRTTLCYERSGECIDLDLLELFYYTSADC